MKICLVATTIALFFIRVTVEFQNIGVVDQLLGMGRNIMGPMIFPGTKWCGKGNIAENYTDLGILKDLDRCCRSHDSCPEIIPARTTQYNLTNTSSFTRLSCDCDHLLYDCLKSMHKIYADIVGKAYFVYSRTKCFKKMYPIVECRPSYEDDDLCERNRTNTDGEPVYQWMDLPNY